MSTGATDRSDPLLLVDAPPAGPCAAAVPSVHEHEWDLRDVEFEGGSSVRRFECTGCELVWFS